MSMKIPPGSISPSAECQDQLQIGPRTRVFSDGVSGSSFWKILAALPVLRQKGFYRRRRVLRECPRSRCGPTWTRGWGLPLPPPTPIKSLST